MYPATIFNWHDNSGLQTTTSPQNTDAPLFMQVFSADKGTEDFVEISGSDFNAMYGTMSFDKHGQSAIQAQRIIDAGGRLFAKRVVATDSTLANVVITAQVSVDGEEVTVTWKSQAIQNCKTFDEVKAAALDLLDDAAGVYPIFVYTDNGRGVSGKAVRLTPDYASSKTIGKTFYTLLVYEGTSITERVPITVDPTVIYNEKAYRLDKYTNVQISGEVLETAFDLYVAKLATVLPIEVDTLRNYDLVYGYTNRGDAIQGFNIDAGGIDLDADNGIAFEQGSNGAFGDKPVDTTAWTNAIVEVFENNNGDHDEIFDVDQHKVAVILDANYPMAVKNAIYDWVSFREDCVFLRDYGLGLSTFLEIKAYKDGIDSDHKGNHFVADYVSTYLVADPTTKKNIRVTMTYDMAALLVDHIQNNPYAPLAGIANGFVLSSAIKGSLNYTPVNTPKANQKEAMDNLRVNYAVFEDNNCVVQSSYSSQDAYTQLSYISNTIAIQRVLRAIRTACPRQRFSLSTGTDLNNYATAVNNVLSNFTSNFSTLNFVYTQDDLRASQKIFYASIEFAFLNWAQTEIFDIYAINNQ